MFSRVLKNKNELSYHLEIINNILRLIQLLLLLLFNILLSFIGSQAQQLHSAAMLLLLSGDYHLSSIQVERVYRSMVIIRIIY